MQTKVPYKLLLQTNQRDVGIKTNRAEQEIQLLSELLINNHIFEYLNLAKNTLRQICDKLVLIWADNPHAIETGDNEAYFILEGKAFEYLQNNNFVLKSRLNERDQYLMIRKILPNDFFIVNSPQLRYSQETNSKKYQLMIDKNTLVGKISGETFRTYLHPLIEQRTKKIVTFLKKVDMLENIPPQILFQLSKYMIAVYFPAGTEIINKNGNNQFVYFIINGQVQYKIYNNVPVQDTPNKNYQTTHIKPFRKSNLRDNEVFGIDAFNSDTYEEVEMSYSTEAKSDTNLYRIDKRILAIVISSFDIVLQKKKNKISSVNLNEQIQGQGYQTADMALLSRNAEKIKTSQKRIRDIKLRFYNTSQRNRQNQNEAEKQQQFYEMQDFKYQSCQSFTPIKVIEDKKKLYETFHPKANFNNFPDFNEDLKSKINNIVISAYDDNQSAPGLRNSIFGQTSAANFTTTAYSSTNSKKSMLGKRKSDPNVMNINSGKEEHQIIRSYLQKKLKNQMLKKAQLILERNKQKKTKQTIKIKRMYSWKSVKNRSNSNKQRTQKEIGQQLFDKMNKLSENPLLSLVEGQRKKLEFQSIKLKEMQQKNRAKQSASPLKKSKKQLIIIQSN